MTTLFLSYRRAESADFTGRIVDRLIPRFGRNQIFLDIDNIPPGVDFRTHIRQWLQKTDVMLVVMGKSWVTATDAEKQTRRLDDPNDAVRVEIETAIKLGITIIPLLVQDAAMPAADGLPESLRPLAEQQPITVRRNPFFDADVAHLQDEIMLRAQHGQMTSVADALYQHWNVPRSRWAIWGLVAAPIIAMGIDWPITVWQSYLGTSQVGPFDAGTIISMLNILLGLACAVMGTCLAVLLPRFPTSIPHGRALQIIDILLAAIVGLPLLERASQMIPPTTITSFFDIIFTQIFNFSLTLPPTDGKTTLFTSPIAQLLTCSVIALALCVMAWLIRGWQITPTLVVGLAVSIALVVPNWLQCLALYQSGNAASPTSRDPYAESSFSPPVPRVVSWQHSIDLITIYPNWYDRLQVFATYGSAVILICVGAFMFVRSLLWQQWYWSAGLLLSGLAQLIVWKLFTAVTPNPQDGSDYSIVTVTLYCLLLIIGLVIWPFIVLLSTLFVRSPTQIEKVPS